MTISHLRNVLAAVFVAAALWQAVPAQAAGRANDTLDMGPKVGAMIPSPLAATDQDGNSQDFASLTGARGLVLLFARSLDWCAFCKLQAVAWNARVSYFRELGYNVVEVTYDSVDALRRFAAREEIGYTLLSDRRSAIIGAFGLIAESVPRDSDWYGFAHPVIFVIDPEGVIRHRFSEANHQVRPDPNAIYEILWREIAD